MTFLLTLNSKLIHNSWGSKMGNALSKKELDLTHAYWRAANYLSIGQIYLYDNPLLKEPLKKGAYQTEASRTLGHNPRLEFHLRSLESVNQRA